MTNVATTTSHGEIFAIAVKHPRQVAAEVNVVTTVAEIVEVVTNVAEMDVVVGMSNCPQERNPCNAFKATPLGITLYES